jgi:hypothetical protein
MTVLPPPRPTFKGRRPGPPAPDEACAGLRTRARRLGYATGNDDASSPVLRGPHGAIYAWSRNRLAVESYDARTSRRLHEAVGWRAPCRLGRGRRLLPLHADLLETAARIIGARRLRRPSSVR